MTELLFINAVIASVILLVAAWAVAWMHERGVHPLRSCIGLLKRTGFLGSALLVAMAFRALVCGGTKAPTNDPPRGVPVPPRSQLGPRIGQPVRSLPEPGISFSAEDIARGYVLWRSGTNETWSFDAPPGASIAEKWRLRGAGEDWVVLTNAGERVVVDTLGNVSLGDLRFRAGGVAMGVLPEAKRPYFSAEGTSTVWFARSAWRTHLVTWQNVLADRLSGVPFSMQVEITEEGDCLCRYDWSCAGGHATNLTSELYYRIRPEDAENLDRDGDGIPTPEEVLVYHTDPGNADTDGDGLPDGADMSPLDPDSDGDGIPDGLTSDEYAGHPLWSAGPGEIVAPVRIRLNEPVVPPSKAVLVVGDLPIVLSTNAVYSLSLRRGVRYDVRLVTNRIAPVNLSIERGE